MKKLLQSMLRRLDAGEETVLCTILASSGSSPRGAGAKMAVFADGSTEGTIGGGAVERNALLKGVEILKGGTAGLHAFTLHPAQVNDIGMICGGEVTVYFQRFTPGCPERATLEKLLALLDEDCNAWLFMRLEQGQVAQFSVYEEQELPAQHKDLFLTKAVYSQGEPTYYTEPVMRRGTVYVFGGGHVGRALVPVLAGLDFRVTVYDNRPDFAKAENFPGASRVLCGDYASFGDQIHLHRDDYVVIMTPGHQGDYEVLEQALRCAPSYVGCIGSRTKIAKTRARLLAAGIPQQVIDTVHAPIGLPIQAQTPAEIAISIAAELILHRQTRQ